MDANFESQKNMKALGITLGICAMLALVLFLVSWTIPVVQEPVAEQGIEVNLGNSDEGLGDVPPMVPGDPAEEATPAETPPPVTAAPAEAVTESKVADDNDDADATPVKSPEKTSVKPKPKQTETIKTTPKKTLPKATAPTPPKPAKPKALYGGGKPGGVGGNNADSYNDVHNQGIAGGHGDQGKPNGNPNSDSYTGNGGSGKSGVTIRSGLNGRRIGKLPRFEDDFNENAKVAVDITVDATGKVLSAKINPKGTTTTNGAIKSIAQRKAMELKLSAGTEVQTGTIVFDFKLNG